MILGYAIIEYVWPGDGGPYVQMAIVQRADEESFGISKVFGAFAIRRACSTDPRSRFARPAASQLLVGGAAAVVVWWGLRHRTEFFLWILSMSSVRFSSISLGTQQQREQQQNKQQQKGAEAPGVVGSLPYSSSLPGICYLV